MTLSITADDLARLELVRVVDRRANDISTKGIFAESKHPTV
jgi:hypothetical protein